MLNKEEKQACKALEKRLGYGFKRRELLRRALTHRSYANELGLAAEAQNERLEFLGDAVLELAISQYLMELYPEYSEGQLSKLRASIVNERQLAGLARRFAIGDHLRLGRGEDQTSGREKNSLLADAYEAILGAIYLDRGFEKAAAVIRKHYSELLRHAPDEAIYQDYKTTLQEKAQGTWRAVPRYKLVGEEGPDHAKTFEIELYLRHELLGRGRGKSKKEAEQMAAKEALEKLAVADGS